MFSVRKINIIVLLLIPVLLVMAGYAGAEVNNHRLSNVSGTSFTVSWSSLTEAGGAIRYGSSIAENGSWQTALDLRGAGIVDDVHYVTVSGIEPSTDFYYEIISGDVTDNNGGNYYSVQTGPALIPPLADCTPAGQVFADEEKTAPAYDSIVYVSIASGSGSSLLSVLVKPDTNGYWFVNLANSRTADNMNFYNYTCGSSEINVEADGGAMGMDSMTYIAAAFTASGPRSDLVLEP